MLSSKPGKKRTGRGSGQTSWMRGRGGHHQTRDTTNPMSPSSPPRNTERQQGHQRTRAKLAANFPSSPD